MAFSLRMAIGLFIGLVTLSACLAPWSLASAPASTLTTLQQPATTPSLPTAEPASGSQAVLASGHYQLLMLYAPT